MSRKSFYDDRVLYCPQDDRIWIGGPDYRVKGEKWTWFLLSGNIVYRPKGKPSWLVEIAREPEQSLK